MDHFQTMFFLLSGPCLDGVQEGWARVSMPDRRLGLMMSGSGLEEEQVRAAIIAHANKNAWLLMSWKTTDQRVVFWWFNIEKLLSISPQGFKWKMPEKS